MATVFGGADLDVVVSLLGIELDGGGKQGQLGSHLAVLVVAVACEAVGDTLAVMVDVADVCAAIDDPKG